MNPDGNRFQPRPRPDMRPNGYGYQSSTAQARLHYPGSHRGSRARATAPRFAAQSQEAALSRISTRTSEGEPKSESEAGLDSLNNFHKEEQTIRNDLALRYATSGEWGGNHIKSTDPQEGCKEYPKLRHLVELKRNQVSQRAHPALHMPFDAQNAPLMSLTTHLPIPFDVILIDPPPSYDWAKITSIPVRLITADPSFVFLWVGDSAGDGLEKGREALLRWGFRRCEEILWVKPNRKAIDARPQEEGKRDDESDVEYWLRVGRKDAADRPQNVMITQKEHCLMGIRGTVRRKTDNWFVHCNVDTDVMVWERDEDDETSPRFPPQLYEIIENFCLGTRRLELFGSKSKARKGWVTLGESDSDNRPDVQEYSPEKYSDILLQNVDALGRNVLPQVEEIEAMRPKSPVRGEKNQSNSSTVAQPRGSTGNQYRSGSMPYDNRKIAFRPSRQQPAVSQPSWTNGPDPVAVPLPPYNLAWGNMPPRMLAPNMGRHSNDTFFAMHRMTAELAAVQNGLYQPSGPEARFLPHTPPEVWVPQGYQPYPPPRPQIMPRFQQYPSNIDQEYASSTLRLEEQTIYPPYAQAVPPFDTPPMIHTAFNGHSRAAPFVDSHNGQHYDSAQTTTGQKGFPEDASQRGYQQWSR